MQIQAIAAKASTYSRVALLVYVVVYGEVTADSKAYDILVHEAEYNINIICEINSCRYLDARFAYHVGATVVNEPLNVVLLLLAETL